MSHPARERERVMNGECITYRVKLSPDFEKMAQNWDLETSRRMANYFADFAHQLQLRVKIAEADREYRHPGKHPLRCVVPADVRQRN